MLASLAAPLPRSGGSRAASPSLVIDFIALWLFGPHAATATALAGIGARVLWDRRARRLWPVLREAATIVAALQAAGWVYGALGASIGSFAWPWQAVPIALGVLVYLFVACLTGELLGALGERRRIDRRWLAGGLERAPLFVIAASLAVGLAEIVVRGAWDVLAVAALPLYLAYRLHRDYVAHREEERCRREVVDSLTHGFCVVDRSGTVTLWSHALERILDCPRERAIGRPFRGAVPGLADADLTRAIADVVRTRTGCTVAQVGLSLAGDRRVLQVKLLPVSTGVTLLWHDITEQARSERSLTRHLERLALAADGANDGLWEWDLRTQALYVTSRWKAMVGLPAEAAIDTAGAWLDRVHADDIAGLKSAIEVHLSGETDCVEHEHRVRHEDGTYRSVLCRGVARAAAGRRPARIAGSLTDTTHRTLTEERLRDVVFRDPLTGLCNRAVFVEGLGERLTALKQRRNRERFAVLYLDLDRFKVINDSLGHGVGDELLIAVSRRLEACLRQGDTLSRLGGDEFAILLHGLETEQQANVVAFRVQEALSLPFSIDGREVFTSASIGIAFGLSQYSSPDEIMHDADTAMYHAKARGKARHEVYDADMDARVRDRLGLENALRHAVKTGGFEVHYQPIVSLASGMCIGFESLVRWTRDGKPVSPATFIPIAEELGLIEPLGTWVLQQACRTFAAWQRRFPEAGLDCITVNVSSRQLMQQNFLSIVEQAVQETGLRPADLRIEITETALMGSPDEAAKVLSDLREFGVRIYLDDFGTGYSSLSHLHKLPVDALKIDRSFVRSLMLPDRPAIVESILALARTLNTSVVAEGIEDVVEARELERLGCTHAQGYLFSRPLSTRAAEEILRANRPLGPKGAEPSDGAAAAGDEVELCRLSA